ncbi:MAG TPA: type II toxin-antitoxin system RelE/ParE family toxin [Chitinispirillaceae bacterium]|nr:type II toxin-antitoxin system RelE/ParE family toxin [Chitinispirillaceae bacterium]
MYKILKTELFDAWLKNLRDLNGKGRILSRIKRAESGNLGDFKALGSGLHEMRIDCGPGYRLYFIKEKDRIIILLSGGSKSSQDKDIKKAFKIMKEIEV